jgi:hypothetical protein
MLAERLGRAAEGAGDKPCTLQVPQISRRIFRRKLNVVALCSMQHAVHQEQRKPKRQDTDGNPHQHERSSEELEHCPMPFLPLLFDDAHASCFMRLKRNSACGDLQNSHSQAPLPPPPDAVHFNSERSSDKFSTGNSHPYHKGPVKLGRFPWRARPLPPPAVHM